MAVVLIEDDGEHPIPIELRPIFEKVAAAFAEGDYRLQCVDIPEVEPLDVELAQFIESSVADYGEELSLLHARVWERSCYSCHSNGCWSAIVDLTTKAEEVSDLALHAKLRLDSEIRVEIWSVHVP